MNFGPGAVRVWADTLTRNDQYLTHQIVTSGAVGDKPRISQTFNRLPRAVGSASVPTVDRAALVGSAKSKIIGVLSPRAAQSFPAPVERSPLARFLARPTSRRSSSAVDTTGTRRPYRNGRNHHTAPARNGAAKHNRRAAPRFHVSPNSCGRGISAPRSRADERTPVPAAARTSDPHSSVVIASDALPPTVAGDLRCSARAPRPWHSPRPAGSPCRFGL